MDEHGQPAFFALRLKVRDRQIVEAEAVVRRKGGPPQFGDPGQYAHDPSFAAATPGRAAFPRATDGAGLRLFRRIAGRPRRPSAVRSRTAPGSDNGVVTTSGETAEGGVQGCQAQIKAGVFSAVRHVRDRRFPIVDEARGVVIAAGFLDLPANSDKAPPARPLSWATTYPYSIGFIAAFKISDGGIYRVELDLRRSALSDAVAVERRQMKVTSAGRVHEVRLPVLLGAVDQIGVDGLRPRPR